MHQKELQNMHLKLQNNATA